MVSQLILIFILIMVNAFFAASEMAIVSVNKTKIDLLNDEGNKKAKILLNLMDEPSKFLATIQVGITLSGYLASASAATTISQPLADVLKRYRVAGGEQIALILVTILLSYFTLVLGELVPKRVALTNPEGIAMFAVSPILFLSKITAPFVKILTFSTTLIVKAFGIHDERLDEKVSREEIRKMINAGEENGVINEIEKEMIDGIFDFDDTIAREIMTPRVNVYAIDINDINDGLINDILQWRFSRIPVYDEEIDNIIGVLYAKDLCMNMNCKKLDKDSIREILRPGYFVPETKNIDELFRELQRTQNHMALLIDEYGAFTGIVTIEDLIEEVMGNIFDEYDEQEEEIVKIDENTYEINGLVTIDEVNEALNVELPSDEFDTIGGFIIGILGYIPRAPEEKIIEYGNLSFKIEEIKEKRINKVKVIIK